MAGFLPPALLKQVRTLALRGRRATEALLGGEVRSVFRGTGMEFTDVRPYAEGDDVRHLDWNLLARTGLPYVKLYTETRELTLLLVVDRSASTTVGDPEPKSARAVEVAAMLALVAAQQQDRVGLLAFGDTVGPVIPPGRGRRHAYAIVQRLFALETQPGETDLAGAIRAAGALLRRRALVVIVSDFLAPGWEAPLKGLSARHEVTAIALDDARETALPTGGWVQLVGAERGGTVLFDSGDATTRKRAEAMAQRQRMRRSAALSAAGVREVVIRTDGEYLPVLRAAFGRQGRRR
ncbi:MAG: DUF58 domain-containing protein [Gemmatimonadales bacterium]|nr:DUF58 domain-containing protein [Gemmatimonadota bacterium]MBP9899737.1 DUF58 domain-containing protein [Gemmatimonadales bacterium]